MGSAQAAVCTLAPGGGDWDATASWTGCTGGAGLNGTDTPGAGDTAIISGGDTVTINFPESVSTLQLSSGGVFIDGITGVLVVDTAFDWAGGTIDGINGTLTLQSPSVSTWNGADLTAINNSFINIEGTVNWTAGLIHLGDSVIGVAPGGVFNANLNAAAETINVQAPFNFGQIANSGSVNKSGTQSLFLDAGVTLDGPGDLDVQSGLFIMSSGVVDGNITIDSGAIMRVEGTALFDSATFSGAGDLHLGPTTPVPGCNVTINSNFAFGLVRVNSCALNFGGSTATMSSLVIDNPMAIVGGPADIDVSSLLTWSEGAIIGGPGETFTLGAGASGSMGGPAGPPVRGLVGRTFINNGMMTAFNGNGLDMLSSAVFQIGASGTVDFAMAAAAVFVVTDDASGNQWINDGNISLTTGQFVGIASPLVNDGTITVNNGTLDLAGDGDGTGDYVINAPGALTVSTATRQLQVGSTVSGTGLFVARDGANVTANGSFAPGSLEVSGPSPALLSYTGLPNIPLDQLLILDDSTFETAGPVQVATTAVLESGTLRDTVGVSLVLLPGATAFLPSTPGSLFTFDDIFFFQSGSATWQGGGIHLDNNASWGIQPSGSLVIDSVTMSPQILGCSGCGSPTLVNQGVITKLAMGTGDDAQINGPIQFFNEGSLNINGGELFIENFVQQGGGGPVTDVSGGALNLGISGGQFNTGFLQGNSSIAGDVSTDAATIRPGTSPGTLTVTGDLVQTVNSVLQAELGGTLPGSFDRLLVSGTASLAGTVNVTQFGGFNPAPPDIFNLIQATGGLSSSAILGANAFPGFGLQATSNELQFLQLGPSSFEVTTTLDPGDGTCDLAGMGDGCTLREAINAANANAGPDDILFNIAGAGVQTIAPLSPLPPITEALFIDGLSQPGALGNTNPADMGGLNGTLLIELSGQNTTGDGLVIDAGSDEVFILGLVINRWSGAGVRVSSTFAIDGSTPSRASAFSARRAAPRGVFAVANILGSYIGTSADGLSVPGPQGNGVVVSGAGASGTIFIGDGLADGRNLISGNVDHGVVISADQVELYGNLIGTDFTGLAALGNGRRGIHFTGDNADGSRIGGGFPASDRNVIAGNGEDGIGFQCAPASPDQCFDFTRIYGNYIGVGVDGLTPVPNANGINFIEMTYGRVEIGSTAVGEGNKIEFNLGAGVLAAPFAVAGTEAEEGRVSINGNVFAGNGGPAIDLGADGRSPNDAMDPDGGFNNSQNFPEITDFLPDTPTPGSTTVEYAVRTDPANALYPLQVEFYRANGDEGFELLGTDSYLLAEAGMLKQFLLPGSPTFAPDDVIIATATDANGKTSEFTYYPVTVEITDDSPDPSLLGDPYSVEVTVTAVSGPYAPLGDVIVDDGETVPQLCGFSLMASDVGTGSCVLASPATTGTLNLQAVFDGAFTPFGFVNGVPDFDPDGEPHTVDNPTSMLLTDAIDPTPVGEPFTLGVAVTASVGGPATGTVNVTSTGGESCSAPLAGGMGSCQLTPLTQGPRTLSAFYIPDPGFDPSSANELHGVVMASSTVVIVSDLPDPSLPGEPVTVVIDVSPSNGANVLLPSGSVMVSANTGESCMIASIDATGGGNCALVFNTTGMRTLTASYSGDSNFIGAVSVAEPHDVNMAPPEETTTTILSTAPSPSVVGQSYVVQVQVSGNMGNTPCGDVQLSQLPDGSMCSAALSPTATPGVASGSCTLTAPNAITKAITGLYQPGACNFNGSQAPLFTHSVNRANTSTTITGQTPNPSTVGQPVTVSFAVAVQAPGAGTPTGTVTVTDGIDVCQATLPASSCQLAFKTEGNRTLTVSYGGDPDFNGSGANGTQTVGQSGSGADLSIRKRNDRCVLPGGTRSSYRIEVGNLGPQAVTGARVQDTVPAPLSNASWTCVASGGASCTASGNGNIDQLVNLPAGSGVVYTLAADVPLSPESVVSNTATVQPPAGVSDPDPSNNSSTDSDPIGIFCNSGEDPFSD